MKKIWFKNTSIGLQPITTGAWVLTACCFFLLIIEALQIYTNTGSGHITLTNFLAYAVLLSAIYFTVAYLTSEKKPWFVNKQFGWGWVPSTWQAWWIILLGLALIVVTTSMSTLEGNSEIEVLISTARVVVVLIAVCYITGEKPKWQWGKKK